MGRASNETNLTVALLKEKAKAQKKWLCGRAGKDDDIIRGDIFFRKGIDWTLNTLDGIISQEIIGK